MYGLVSRAYARFRYGFTKDDWPQRDSRPPRPVKQVEFRAATPRDEVRIDQIHQQSLGRDFDLQRHLEKPEFQVMLAVSGGVVAGMMVLQHLELPGEEPTNFLWSMAVAPEFRGQKIGQQLLQEGLELAESDTGECHLQVAKENHAAQQLYDKHGFEPVAYDGWLDQYVMKFDFENSDNVAELEQAQRELLTVAVNAVKKGADHQEA